VIKLTKKRFTTSKRKQKNVLLRFLAYGSLVFIVIPYTFIFLLNTWQTRWFFGLVLWSICPFLFLGIVLNPKVRMTDYDPKELSSNRYILRHLGIFFRVLVLIFVIGAVICETIPYVRSSFLLISNNWQLERINGVIKKSDAIGRTGIFFREIGLEQSKDRFRLIYPFGKRHHPGQQCELLLLPGTHIAVDLRLVLPLNSSGDLGERIVVPENLNQGERK
jgi:hypothetical protein